MSEIRKDFNIKYRANLVANMSKYQHIHDVTSLALGTSAGILQLESYHGLVYFLVTNLAVFLTFFIVVLRGQAAEIPKYFDKNLVGLVFEGISRSLAGFFMMWCLSTALVST